MTAFNPGDPVQVRTDAPSCAGQYGTVAAPKAHGDVFGYWLDLDGDLFWIPAAALIPLTANGGEQP